jgi:hypothetical protein
MKPIKFLVFPSLGGWMRIKGFGTGKEMVIIQSGQPTTF